MISTSALSCSLLTVEACKGEQAASQPPGQQTAPPPAVVVAEVIRKTVPVYGTKLFSAELDLAKARREELLAGVQLYRALGGGWRGLEWPATRDPPVDIARGGRHPGG